MASLTVGFHSGVTQVTAQYAGSGSFNPSPVATKSITVGAQNGAEARVNSRTTGTQDAAAIVGLGGPYSVAWMSDGQDGSAWGIYGQRYAASGAKAGAEFRANAVTANAQALPAVAALNAGRWVAVWQSIGEDGSGAGIYGRIYAADGVAGPVFRVNGAVVKNQSRPAVAGLAGGGFVVVYTTDAITTAKLALLARRFDANGVALAAEARVDVGSVGFAQLPSVAGLTDGSWVVAWRQADVAQTTSAIRQQRYGANGAPIGAQATVNTDGVRPKSEPDVAALAGGQWVVVWTSDGQDGSGLGVYSQRFAAGTGAKLGAELRVPAVTANAQSQPSVAGFPSGGHVVAWTSNGQDGSGSGVYMRRYDGAGAAVDGVFPVNTFKTNNQHDPDVATLGNRDFVVVWTSDGQDVFGGGIYAQRYKLGIDANLSLP